MREMGKGHYVIIQTCHFREHAEEEASTVISKPKKQTKNPTGTCFHTKLGRAGKSLHPQEWLPPASCLWNPLQEIATYMFPLKRADVPPLSPAQARVPPTLQLPVGVSQKPWRGLPAPSPSSSITHCHTSGNPLPPHPLQSPPAQATVPVTCSSRELPDGLPEAVLAPSNPLSTLDPG